MLRVMDRLTNEILRCRRSGGLDHERVVREHPGRSKVSRACRFWKARNTARYKMQKSDFFLASPQYGGVHVTGMLHRQERVCSSRALGGADTRYTGPRRPRFTCLCSGTTAV